MKKYLFILLTMLLLSVTGCNQNPANTTEATTEESLPVQETSILDKKEPLDEKGILSYISSQYVEDNLQQQIYNFQENLLIAGSYYDAEKEKVEFRMELVSTQTGELLCEKSIESIDTPLIQILDRNVIVSDTVTGKILILNASLEIEKEYEVGGGTGESELGEGTIFLNRMMTKAFCIDQEDGVRVVDLTDGSSKRWMKQIKDAYVSRACGDYVTLAYTDGQSGLSTYGLLNLAAEEVDILDLNKSLYGVEHNSRVWLAGLVGKSGQYLYGTEEVPQVMKLEEGIMPSLITNSDNLILTRPLEDGSLELIAYYPDGTYLSSGILKNGSMGYWGNIVWFESLHGYLMTNIEEPGIDKLYYWDTTVETEGENLTFSEMESEVQAGDSVSEDLYKKAEAIGDKYGITIKIAEQCETDYGTYTVEQNMNEEKISRGLDVLDMSLSAYPDGFIQQLRFGYYRELEINLMGNIYATEQVEENKNGFDSFIAFVQEREEKYVMTFDLNRGQLIEQDLYHEFSHLIDKKLQNMADQGKTKKYSEEAWAALNPADFEYAYSYSDVPSSYYYDGYDDYFVDVYSRTFPTEDRARIMEYAMIDAEFCFDTYPELVTKLRFYCECIREGFDTTGWPEVTKWEEMLFLVD